MEELTLRKKRNKNIAHGHLAKHKGKEYAKEKYKESKKKFDKLDNKRIEYFMKKFTYILEYKRNVYINQVDAKDLSESLRKWHTNFDYKHAKGVGVKSYLNLASIYQDDDYYPTELNFMKHIWCRSILLDNNRESALINIIESDVKSPSDTNLFSFILLYDGGTYISQVKTENEKKL